MIVKAEKMIVVEFDKEAMHDQRKRIDLYTHKPLRLKLNLATLINGDKTIYKILKCFSDEELLNMEIANHIISGQGEPDIQMIVKHEGSAFMFSTTLSALARSLDIGYTTLAIRIVNIAGVYNNTDVNVPADYYVQAGNTLQGKHIAVISRHEIVFDKDGNFEICPFPITFAEPEHSI